ncbi:MAG TPA: glycosyltransferase family 2 protein [Nitrospirales bacterium]|nr:glycosyltransferase family 2 protein [Nitrospirales bacterium]
MPKLSVCLMTYNEASKIRDALESVRWADEIVVVDSGSADRTVEICREYTSRIHTHPFKNFGNQRNVAAGLATHDWVLSLDADERVTPELRDEMRRVLADDPGHAAYHIPRKNFFLGRWIRHGGWYPDYRHAQLFQRHRARYTETACHEGFTVDGSIGRLREHVIQYPFTDIAHFLEKHNRYSSLMAEQMRDAARPFHAHQLITHPVFTFIKMYLLRQGFRDGVPGLILAGLYANYTFAKYAKLWALQSAAMGSRPRP